MIYRKLRPPSPPSYYSRISLSLVKRVRFLFLCFFFFNFSNKHHFPLFSLLFQRSSVESCSRERINPSDDQSSHRRQKSQYITSREYFIFNDGISFSIPSFFFLLINENFAHNRSENSTSQDKKDLRVLSRSLSTERIRTRNWTFFQQFRTSFSQKVNTIRYIYARIHKCLCKQRRGGRDLYNACCKSCTRVINCVNYIPVDRARKVMARAKLKIYVSQRNFSKNFHENSCIYNRIIYQFAIHITHTFLNPENEYRITLVLCFRITSK